MVLKFIQNIDTKSKINFSSYSYVILIKMKFDDIKKADIVLKKHLCNQVPKIFRAPHFGEYSEKIIIRFNFIIVLNDYKVSLSSSTTPIYSLINYSYIL